MDYGKDEIRDLLLEKIAGTISEQNDHLVNEAIARFPDIEREWLVLKAKFDSSPGSTYLHSLDTGKSWSALRSKLHTEPFKKPDTFRVWMAAASFLIIGGLASYFMFFYNQTKGLTKPSMDQVRLELANGSMVNLSDSTKAISVGHMRVYNQNKQLSFTAMPAKAVSWLKLVVPVKEFYKIKLPDSTEVILNAMSVLKFPDHFTGDSREVFLTGEAYFKVTSNKKFPFIVHTSSGNIKVLGTVFNVQAYDSNKLVTSLVTGKVLLQFADQEKYLQAGHRGTISNSGYTDELFDQNRDLGWLSGEAYLNNTPLKEIAPLLNRWYAIKTVFASPDIADIKLSGIVFRDKPITLFLSSIEFSSHLKATLKDSTVYISH